MSLTPDPSETLARAYADLRMGLPVGVRGLGLVLAAETASEARVKALRALGAVDLVITDWRAQTLKARAYDGDVARLVLPADADARWIGAVADPAGDLAHPMKGPLTSRRDGDPALAHLAISLTKRAQLLPAALILPMADTSGPAGEHGLTETTREMIRAEALAPFRPVISARVPLKVSTAALVHVFRPQSSGEEHNAVEIGRPDRDKPVLARLHSACFTGDVLGSLKCDCGPQLQAALAQMGEEGEGVLLYLNQEGRGIGLANKMRAYSLQDQGFDTVEANHRLGFEDDERDFRIGADILRRLGFSSVRLMTNNPAKIARMESCGIAVTERVPLRVGETAENRAYLATKRAKSGHLS